MTVSARKAARLPKQNDRASQDATAAIDKAERDQRVSPDHLRGEGKLKAGVVLTGSVTTTISHGLGRTPRGWHLLSLRASSAVGFFPRETERTKTTLRIANDSATDATVDLWIY